MTIEGKLYTVDTVFRTAEEAKKALAAYSQDKAAAFIKEVRESLSHKKTA